MTKFSYHYNPETCQYERVRPDLRETIIYIAGLIVMACVFLAIMLILHNHFVETQRELTLRTENKMLVDHKIILTEEMSRLEASLLTLKRSDQELYFQLFHATSEENLPKHTTISKEQVLLADASAFRTLLDNLVIRCGNAKAKWRQHHHALQSITAQKTDYLNAIPTRQPIDNPEVTKLVSGFGNRINPFHKGMHHHAGTDFAASRGTVVKATAPGTVTDIKKSTLEAGYGNYIEIRHGYEFVTRYAHLEDILVKRGQHIDKGTAIGTVGSTGGSTAPHVHYEIIHAGESVDPVPFMLEGLDSERYHTLIQLGKKQNQSLD